MDEVLEIALRVDKLENVETVNEQLETLIEDRFVNKDEKVTLEVHPWTKLTNFTGTLTIIDVMALFLKLYLFLSFYFL